MTAGFFLSLYCEVGDDNETLEAIFVRSTRSVSVENRAAQRFAHVVISRTSCRVRCVCACSRLDLPE